MDTSDAQASLGSDGIIESHPTPIPSNHEPIPASEASTKLLSPVQNKTTVLSLSFDIPDYLTCVGF